MSKDTMKVNMNVYDIPIVVEQLKKLEQENKQLKEENERLKEWKEDLLNENIALENIRKEAIEYINNNCVLSDEWTDLGFCNFIPSGKITYKQLTPKKVKELLKILGDKENE